ncbi:MAG: glutathione S-transferase family protein [Reyranellaceae bacterium]
MKLYGHPASTVSRPVAFFAADNGIPLEHVVVDLFTGEQYGPAFTAINPNNAVPVLEDGDFRLTESSAILKYLADKVGSPTYPKDLRRRAEVNAAMDWFNTGFYRTLGYGLCYAQLLDPYKLADPTGQAQALAAARAAAERQLGILDRGMLGNGRPFVCGADITLADYFGSGILSLGAVIGCTYAAWPNVVAWYERLKARPGWPAGNAGLQAWVDLARGPDYVRL